MKLKEQLLKISVIAYVFTPGLALAATDTSSCGPGAGGALSGADCAQPSSSSAPLFGQGGLFQKVADTLIFLVGAIAVIMLIIGGLRYVISQGNDKNVAAAKDTILYAVIGIIVAILAFAAVQFITSTVQGTGTPTSG